jgi:hypothetical protein
MKEKLGILVSWRQVAGHGTVVVKRNELYFLHTSNIVEGPEVPVLGSLVHFDVRPAQNGGKFPQAVNATIEAVSEESSTKAVL